MNPLALAPSTFSIGNSIPSREDGTPREIPPRLTVTQVVSIIRAMAGIGTKALTIGFRSPPQGLAGERWMEARAEGYQAAFWVNDGLQGSLASIFYCKTPKGAEWFAPQDQGNPTAKFTANELDSISRALYVGWPEDHFEILVAQIWRVAIRTKDGGVSFVGGSFDHGPTKDGTRFPKELLGHSSFATREQAEPVRKAYEEYRMKSLKQDRDTKDNPPPKKNKS